MSTLEFTSPSRKQTISPDFPDYRAKAPCDQDSVIQDLKFLTTIFKDNGYSPQQIQALKPANRPPGPMKDPPLIAFIPYTLASYGQLSRILAKHSIKSVSSTKENLHLPSTCQGCFWIENAGCVQHPM